MGAGNDASSHFTRARRGARPRQPDRRAHGLQRRFRAAFGLELDDVSLAQLGQLAENEFVGAHTGIMDQMAANLADDSTALFLDTRSLEFRRVPLPAEADLVVIHSGVAHEISAGDYNTRRAGAEEAARRLGGRKRCDLNPA